MTQKNESVKFFKFEKIGAEVKGTFKGFFESQYGLTVQIDSNYVDLNKSQLRSKFKNIFNDLKVNKTKLSIKFVSEQSKKGRKNPLKIFDVFVDGKKVESSGILKSASLQNIKSFFQD